MAYPSFRARLAPTLMATSSPRAANERATRWRWLGPGGLVPARSATATACSRGGYRVRIDGDEAYWRCPAPLLREGHLTACCHVPPVERLALRTRQHLRCRRGLELLLLDRGER